MNVPESRDKKSQDDKYHDGNSKSKMSRHEIS